MNQLRGGNQGSFDRMSLRNLELLIPNLPQPLLCQSKYHEPSDDAQADQMKIKGRAERRVPSHVQDNRNDHGFQKAPVEKHAQRKRLIVFHPPQRPRSDGRPSHMAEWSQEGPQLNHVEHHIQPAALLQELKGIAGALEEGKSGAYRRSLEQPVEDVFPLKRSGYQNDRQQFTDLLDDSSLGCTQPAEIRNAETIKCNEKRNYASRRHQHQDTIERDVSRDVQLEEQDHRRQRGGERAHHDQPWNQLQIPELLKRQVETEVNQPQEEQHASKEPGLRPVRRNFFYRGSGAAGTNHEVVIQLTGFALLENLREELAQAEAFQIVGVGEAGDVIADGLQHTSMRSRRAGAFRRALTAYD